MSVAEALVKEPPVDDEARLARAAVDGDGAAFASLYERHEARAFNLAFRITGSREDAADAVQEAFLGVLRRLPDMGDRELAFGSYVLTATRNACYDLIEGRRRAQPSDSIPDSATPVGGGAGGLGLDPGDPEEDPTRRQLLDSQRGEIRDANSRLPERQREVLALRELEGLSYDEIAAIMEMNRNSVAQLISRARLNLRDELRGAALSSIPPASAECERALPLIAGREDGELDDDRDRVWLEGHLTGCEGCRLRLEAMQEAGVSYRAWAPIAAVPWLFRETMARAAEHLGADWSELIAEREAARAQSGSHRIWPFAATAVAILVLVALLTASELDTSVAPPPEAEPAVRVAQGVAPAAVVAERDAADDRGGSQAPTPDEEPAESPVIPLGDGDPNPSRAVERKPNSPSQGRQQPGETSGPGARNVPAETPPALTPELEQPPPPREPEVPGEEPETPDPETPKPTGPNKFAPNPGPPPVP